MRRRMITPMLTTTNANSVPMLTSWTISLSGTNAASAANSTPQMPMIRTGARDVGFTFEMPFGISPSRLIAKRMRDWP